MIRCSRLVLGLVLGLGVMVSSCVPPRGPASAAGAPPTAIVLPAFIELGKELHVAVWVKGIRDPEYLRSTMVDIAVVGPGIAARRSEECLKRFEETYVCSSYVTDNSAPRLMGNGFPVDAALLSEGPYEIAVARKGKLLAQQTFKLMRVPSTGGKHTWVVDPTQTSGQLYATEVDSMLAAWLPIDARFTEDSVYAGHFVRFVWFAGEQVVDHVDHGFATSWATIDTVYDAGVDTPILALRSFWIARPKATADSLYALVDGKYPAASWRVADQNPSVQMFARIDDYPPLAMIAPVAADPKLVAVARKLPPRDKAPAPMLREPYLCGVATNPRARQLIEEIATTQEKIDRMASFSGAQNSAAADRVRTVARLHGREVTGEEVSAAQVHSSGSSLDDELITKKKALARLGQGAKPGCYAALLGPAAKFLLSTSL